MGERLFMSPSWWKPLLRSHLDAVAEETFWASPMKTTNVVVKWGAALLQQKLELLPRRKRYSTTFKLYYMLYWSMYNDGGGGSRSGSRLRLHFFSANLTLGQIWPIRSAGPGGRLSHPPWQVFENITRTYNGTACLLGSKLREEALSPV